MQVEQAGFVPEGKVCQPGEDLPAIGQEGVDETKFFYGVLYYFEAVGHACKSALLSALDVVSFGFAVDADGDQIELTEDAAGVWRRQEHAVGDNGVAITQGVRGLCQLLEMEAFEGFAAAEMDDVITEGGRLFEEAN